MARAAPKGSAKDRMPAGSAVTVRLPAPMLQAIDELAAKQTRTRTNMIEHLLRVQLESGAPSQ